MSLRVPSENECDIIFPLKGLALGVYSFSKQGIGALESLYLICFLCISLCCLARDPGEMMPDPQSNYEVQNRAQAISESDPFTDRRYMQFYRHFQPGARTVLDVGCNTGRGGKVLEQIDPNLAILGLDCVPDRLDVLPACYTKKILGLSTEIPLPDRSIDVVVAGEFLEHLYPIDADRTLSEFQRILVIGGRLLLTSPNPNYILNRLRGRTAF